MSETFSEALAGSAAIAISFVVAFMVLGTYLNFNGKRNSKAGPSTRVIHITGVLAGDAPVDVYLLNGEIIHRGKIRQFEFKDYLPYAFHDMLVVELEQGGFTMLRPDRIQRIDLPNYKDIAMTVNLKQSIETMDNN